MSNHNRRLICAAVTIEVDSPDTVTMN